jgi:hypothetical protein
MSGSSGEKSLSKTGKARTKQPRRNNPNTTILQIVEILDQRISLLHIPVDDVGAIEPIKRIIAKNLSYPDLDGAESVGHDKQAR